MDDSVSQYRRQVRGILPPAISARTLLRALVLEQGQTRGSGLKSPKERNRKIRHNGRPDRIELEYTP